MSVTPAFLLASSFAGLPNARTLAAGANVTITDGGAGGALTINAATPGSGAPLAAPYLTFAADGTLTNERTLTAGAGVSLTQSTGLLTVASTTINAPYVTVGTDGTLPNERALTGGTGITITDGGAGGPVTVGLATTPAPANAQYLVSSADGTLTNERVLTAGSGVTLTPTTGVLTIAATGGGAGAFLNVLDAGVSQGAQANNTARALNTTNWNTAITSAQSTGKILVVPPGSYEIYGALIINTNNFRWLGSMNTIITQYNLGVPVVHMGPANGTAAAVCFGNILDGAQLKFSGTATSAGRAFEGSSLYQCRISNILAGDIFQAVGGRVSVPYDGFWFDEAVGTTPCFSNVFENIQLNFFQRRGWSMDRLGYEAATGNVFTNIYIRGGGAGGNQDNSAISGAASMLLTAFTQGTFTQLNLEWNTSPSLLVMVDVFQTTFNSVNMEGNRLKSSGSQVGAVIDAYQCQVTFDGLTIHDTRVLAANNQSKGLLFRLGNSTTCHARNMRVYQMTNVDVGLYVVGGNSPTNSRFYLDDLQLGDNDSITGFDDGTYSGSGGYWGAMGDFNGSGLRTLPDSNTTIYAYRSASLLLCPSSAVRTHTLAKVCSASISAIIPPGVRTRMRNTGASTITIKDYDGTTTIGTIASGASAEFAFSGSNWLQV